MGPVLLHLGPLHPAEQLMTLLLAFGPFVLLGVTIWLSRRRDAREDVEVTRDERGTGPGSDPGPDQGHAPVR